MAHITEMILYQENDYLHYHDTDIKRKYVHNMDAIEEGDAPDQWRPPDIVINNTQDFGAYTSGTQTP